MSRQSPHGTLYAYRGGCHCGACRSAMTDANRKYRMRRAQGNVSPVVDASECGKYLRRLASIGIGRRVMVKASGVSSHTLWAIENGRQKMVTAKTRDRILGITIDDAPGTARVDSLPTLKLLVAMLDAGITRDQIAAALKHKKGDIPHYLGPQRVTVRTFQRVQTIYRYLATQGIVPASVMDEVGG